MSRLEDLCLAGASREEIIEAQSDEIESLRQQLAATTAERDEFAGYAKDGTVIAAQLQTKLSDSQKREVMLREALEYHQAQTRPIQRTEEALAATEQKL